MNTDESLKGHDAVARAVTSRMGNNSQTKKKVFFILFSLIIQNQKEIFSKDPGLKVSSKKELKWRVKLLQSSSYLFTKEEQ